MIEEITDISNQILTQSPGAVVRYRLLRDVLSRAPEDSELREAKQNLTNSRQIQELAREQWQDGGWGAFHSRKTKRKQKIPTTEVGVERALALGLDGSHPILVRTADYIQKIITGASSFPDYHEKNDRWPTGMRLFLASTLSRIQPSNPILDQDRALWKEVAARTFQTGKYDQESEIRAHAELTGATVKNSYLLLGNRYQLNLFGSLPGMFTREFEKIILEWLWNKPDGIGYLGIPFGRRPAEKPDQIDRYLSSLELLAHGFASWVEFAQPAIAWLWESQNDQGFWDFGPRPRSRANLPLSDNWRRKSDRDFDWTTRVLVLLRQFYDGLLHEAYA